MRKKKYYFNDGLDGVVLAKSRKQAIGILRKNGYEDFTKQEIRVCAKRTDKDFFYESSNGVSWIIEAFATKRKGKSGMIGWCE